LCFIRGWGASFLQSAISIQPNPVYRISYLFTAKDAKAAKKKERKKGKQERQEEKEGKQEEKKERRKEGDKKGERRKKRRKNLCVLCGLIFFPAEDAKNGRGFSFLLSFPFASFVSFAVNRVWLNTEC
jgi:hypothetical protein